MGFPCGSKGKESARNAGDLTSMPGLEVPMEKKMQPTPVFLPGKSHGLRSLADYRPWGRKELDTTDLDMKLVLEMICHHFT